jgi:hypothetical protein
MPMNACILTFLDDRFGQSKVTKMGTMAGVRASTEESSFLDRH